MPSHLIPQFPLFPLFLLFLLFLLFFSDDTKVGDFRG
jgi:hypothetical protein